VTQQNGGPLEGLRVVDLTDDMGRFAAKLLVEGGADVVRVSSSGSPGAAMASADAAALGGVVDWWYDGGKRRVDVDLDDEAGRDAYRQLATAADLVLETTPPGRLAALSLDHADLVGDNPTLVQVSLTPFGRHGPRAGWATSDLVAGAMGGVLSITGPPDSPLNSYGRQSYNFGGFMSAITGLAAVRSARATGQGSHVDLSLHEIVATSIENLFFQYFYDDLLPIPKIALRQGSLHWLGAYKVVPAATGNVMITVTPDYEALFRWMAENGFDDCDRYLGIEDVMELVSNMAEIMDAVSRFAATKPSGELFNEAQKRHIAFGEVQTIEQVAANPQYEHRQFFADATWDGSQVRMPGRLARLSGTPLRRPAPPAGPAEAETAADVAAAWREAAPAAPGDEPAGKPLAGLRVLDLTWVLAGPFCTRLLGDLGADVLKLQTVERATSVNDPEHPYFPVWNRSKRSITIDMRHPDALELTHDLLDHCDVLVENYSAGVVARWGLGYDDIAERHPGLVYVSMSGCGHDGPWQDVISYAPTIHALCGMTQMTNPPGRGDVGVGFSLNDHAAGFAAALLILECLEGRRRTGRGQYVDLAQLEVGSYLLGPALLDALSNGRIAEPAGNIDGIHDHVPNEVYLCRDGRHLAITCVTDGQWAALVDATGVSSRSEWATEDGRRSGRAEIDAALAEWASSVDADAATEQLQAAGVAAGPVQNADDLFLRDPQLQARELWTEMEHSIFGRRPHDRFPATFGGDHLDPYLPSPYLGEHNFDVFAELLGWDAERVADAIAGGLLQ
jgi:crotonobetainyl-CoA:carnitine CoA-transferase CaiB-like acyl-CoA transferase